MQSGISASEELQSAFASYASDTSLFALPVTITSESLKPLSPVPFSASAFDSSLQTLSEHLQPKTPLYLFLRRQPNDASFVAVTYVPSTAPVRSKTLFASTRSTLIRELGQEKFSRQVFCTEAHEILDPQEWAEREGRATSDVSSARDDLLTREERELQGVKRAEDEERHGTSGRDIGWGGGTGKPGGGGSVGMKMKLDDGVQQALGSLGEDGQVVQLGIDLPTETIKLRLSESNVAPSKLPSVIPEAEPSYTFYNYPSSGIIFIYTCPASTSVKGRMVYASSRNNVVSLAKENGLEVSKRIEAGEPEDITESRLKEEMDPKVEVETKSGFARPKRPGRR